MIGLFEIVVVGVEFVGVVVIEYYGVDCINCCNSWVGDCYYLCGDFFVGVGDVNVVKFGVVGLGKCCFKVEI